MEQCRQREELLELKTDILSLMELEDTQRASGRARTRARTTGLLETVDRRRLLIWGVIDQRQSTNYTWRRHFVLCTRSRRRWTSPGVIHSGLRSLHAREAYAPHPRYFSAFARVPLQRLSLACHDLPQPSLTVLLPIQTCLSSRAADISSSSLLYRTRSLNNSGLISRTRVAITSLDGVSAQWVLQSFADGRTCERATSLVWRSDLEVLYQL